MANIMELMREYKHLKQLKQAGTLNSGDEARLREVATFLQGAMQNRKGGAPSSASSAPKPKPQAPVPQAQPAPPAPAKPAAPAGVPDWQKRKQEQEERQRRAQARFQVAVPDEVSAYQPASSTDATAPEGSAAETAPTNTKKRKRPTSEAELVQQLKEIHSASLYEPSFAEMQTEMYFSYLQDGYTLVEDDAETAELEPIDPRETELKRAGLLSSSGAPVTGTATITCVPGGVFLDDFLTLYEKGVLPSPEDDVEPDIDDPNALVPGTRKVTLHMLNGEVKRGTVKRIMRGDQGFTLLLGRGRQEEIAFAGIKALFIMKGKASQPDTGGGRRLTVEFKDRRRIAGVSSDYQPNQPYFTIIPSGRGNFERVIVNTQAAARVG